MKTWVPESNRKVDAEFRLFFETKYSQWRQNTVLKSENEVNQQSAQYMSSEMKRLHLNRLSDSVKSELSVQLSKFKRL